MRGDVDESTEFFEEVERSSTVANQRAYALAELSLGHGARGDAERALTTADAAREVLREAGGEDLFLGAIANAAIALAAIGLISDQTD
jgi:transcriptional regulator GlxA family with amidase domain